MKFEDMVFYWVRNSEMKNDYEINDETALKEDYKKVYLVGPVNRLVGGLEKEILEKEESNKRYVGQLILALKTKDNEIAELCLERNDNQKAIDELNAENRKLKSDITDLRDDKKLTDAILGERNLEIAELKAQKAQAEDDCAYWKMREGNAVNAMHETEEACMFLTKSERHQKYKRCLAMAKWCAAERDIYNLTPNFAKMNFYKKWCKRWLKLAEMFK